MGRGDNNLLYGAPRISKVGRGYLLEEGHIGSLPDTIIDIVAGENTSLSLIKSSDDRARLKTFALENPEKKSSPAGNDFPFTKEGSLFSLASDAIAWVNKGKIYIKNTNFPRSDPRVYATPAITGEIIGIYLSDTAINILWSDTMYSEEARLSQITRDEGVWRNFTECEHDGQARLDGKGDKAIIIYYQENGYQDHVSILTVSKDGPGQINPVPPSVKPIITKVDLDLTLSPAAVDGTYFYCDEFNDHLCFLDLREDVPPEKRIHKIAPFRGKENVIDLAVSGDRALLLSKTSLTLYDKRGFLDEVPLSASEGYDKISVSGSRIILWREGSKNYRIINLQENLESRSRE